MQSARVGVGAEAERSTAIDTALDRQTDRGPGLLEPYRSGAGCGCRNIKPDPGLRQTREGAEPGVVGPERPGFIEEWFGYALVRDVELKTAMRWAYEQLRIVLEPSGAAALAIALREGEGRCGVILTGGNVDPALFASIAQQAAAPC